MYTDDFLLALDQKLYSISKRVAKTHMQSQRPVLFMLILNSLFRTAANSKEVKMPREKISFYLPAIWLHLLIFLDLENMGGHQTVTPP